MKIFATTALLAGAVLLSACGGGSAQCKDEASATAYAQKWQADFQAAMTAGKIDATKAAQAMQDMGKDMESIGNDYAAGCKKLDELRSKLGF